MTKNTPRANRTPAESVQSLMGRRRTRDLDARKLAGLAAVHYAISQSGLTVWQFGKRYVEKVTHRSGAPKNKESARSNEIYQYRNGDVTPNLSTITRIDEEIPGTLAIFTHPLFVLLEDRPISVAECHQELSPFQSRIPEILAWQFPNDIDLSRQHLYVASLDRCDTRTLIQRGDVNGFAVALGIAREAEARRDVEAHRLAMADLYRGVPALVRAPHLSKHRSLVFYCLQRVHIRCKLSFETMQVDWKLIRELSKRAVIEKLQKALSTREIQNATWGGDLDPVNLQLPLPKKRESTLARRERRAEHRRNKKKSIESEKDS